MNLSANSTDKRKPIWVTNGFNGQVDVEVGPIEVVGGWEFDVQDLADRDIPKPRKFGERQKQLFIVEQ